MSKAMIILGVLGGLLAFVGARYSIPALTSLGIVGVGLAAIVAGVEMLVTRRATFFPEHERGTYPHQEEYLGCAAQLWGILFCAFGAILVVLAVLAWRLPGGGEAFWDRVLSTPRAWGVLLLGVGAMVSLYAVIRLLAGDPRVYGGMRLGAVLGRLEGVYFLFVGVGLVVLGGLLVVAPRILLGLAGRLAAFVREWLAR